MFFVGTLGATANAAGGVFSFLGGLAVHIVETLHSVFQVRDWTGFVSLAIVIFMIVCAFKAPGSKLKNFLSLLVMMIVIMIGNWIHPWIGLGITILWGVLFIRALRR